MFKDRAEANAFYDKTLLEAEAQGPEAVRRVTRELCLEHLFFLLTRVLKRADIDKDWLWARCEEVQDDPDGYLDLWAREHYKSTIITFGKTIQDVLKDPEITVGIFSCTRPIAKAFLAQIKSEFEDNGLLKQLFDDVLYQNPQRESPRWSLDSGIVVKRKTNPKEATIEAWGLVDGQPTSKHFSLLVYDDVVTLEFVTTPDMIAKVTDRWAVSLNLGAHGGRRRTIGTRYHFNDTYREMIARGAVVERKYPATVDGKPDGEPVFLTHEQNAKKRQEMGPYVYACHGAGTLVTMADWSQKAIEDVRVGDVVVGWAAIDGSKSILTPTRVAATSRRTAPAIESVLVNGDVLVHTPDHKWWTGRAATDRKAYSPLGFEFAQQKGLCRALDLSFLHEELTPEQMHAAGYLAGIIDGEGGVRHRTLQITQDAVLHPRVCEKIEWALQVLGFTFGVFDRDRRGLDTTRKNNGVQRTYTVHGGRQARVRLLHILGPFLGKKQDIVSQAYGARDFGKKSRVALKAQANIGEVEVFNIQTETGNYIANGYCSKNCQMLQDPKADEAQGFLLEWLRPWMPKPEFWLRMNLYIIVDPAGEKKLKNTGTDYTVMWVVGVAPDNRYYLIDGLRDRLNLTQRAQKLMSLVRKYRPLRAGYEKYGLQADIEHIRFLQDQQNYHFEVVELGGQMPKNDRIRRLIPLFEQARFYTPGVLTYKDTEGSIRDLMREFEQDEYLAFPVCVHDDMLDCLARILDPDLGVVFPDEDPEVELKGGYPNMPTPGTGMDYDPLGHMA